MGARCQWQRCQFLVHYAPTYRLGVIVTACASNGASKSLGVVNWQHATTLLTPRTRSVAVFGLEFNSRQASHPFGCSFQLAVLGGKGSILDGERISKRASNHEHDVEGDQQLQPSARFDNGATAQ